MNRALTLSLVLLLAATRSLRSGARGAFTLDALPVG
jgi:hypothetical protein